MNYKVYVIQNPAGKRYIGITDDVNRRLLDHNSGVSQWTKGKGPWSLVWTSEAMSLSDARRFENKLKRQGRGSGFYTITGLLRP
jgi:putative endonuclease